MSEEKASIYQLPPRIRGDHFKTFQDSTIKTNHYQVKLSDINKIVIFRVHFTPKIPHDNSKLRNSLFQKCKSQISKNITNPVYSGMNIYSTVLLDDVPVETKYESDGYQLNVKRVKVFDLESNPKLLLTFLNNGLRNIMRNLNFVEIGKSGKYFNAQEKTKLDNLMMYNGYKSNFVQLQRGYYLRVDAAKKIVRNDTVLDFINQIYAKHTDKSKQEKRSILRSELVDKIVMANYGKTRYHKIMDLKFQEISSITFENNTTMVQYYKDKYEIEIKNLKQPLLVVEGSRKEETVLVIPELMLMTGIPDDFDEMRRKKISQSTIKGPRDKLQEIGGLMKKLKTTKEVQALGKIGLKLNENMAQIKGKTMPCPTLQLGKSNTIEKGKEACFNLFNKPIFASKHDIQLGVIFSKGTDIKSLLQTFEQTARNLGVKLNINTHFQISNSRMSVKDIERQLNNASQKNCNICLIVIPGNLKNDYKKIKIAAIVGEEMITQVLTDAKLRNKNAQSIATKVLLQIIAKRGNTLWISKPTCTVEKTMLVGFDTCKVGSKTLLAISAFINSTFSTIFSKTAIFEGGENKYIKMIELLLAAVNSFVERNQKKPKEIVVFQNSCAGDQAKLYYQFFVTPFNNKVMEVYGESISWSLVMVNVKTSERFFLGENNVNAGTLIARDVVSNNYDFYVVSQRSNRGTSVPNHYKVIYSNSTMEEGILQELAFSQCFNYVNWTGSIKVPSVLQYAKKCAKFGSQVMQNQVVPESLQNRMYFV